MTPMRPTSAPRLLSMTWFLLATAVAATILASAAPATAQTEIDARPNERTQPRDTIARSRYTEPIDIISGGVEFAASPGGGTFFGDYATLGGEQTGLDSYLAPVLTGRLTMTENLLLTVYTSLHRTSFAEVYTVRSSPDPREPALAGVSEEFSALAVPIAAGIEFAPIRTQFTSYVGAGAGLALTQTKWLSTVQYSNGGYTRPARNTDQFGVAPIVRAYAGVDLRFDKGSIVRSAFRGIYLEASYLWLPVARDYFGAIRSQGAGIEAGPGSDDATLYLGGLSFTFGVNLQVLRK
jgi:hypothetical protein